MDNFSVYESRTGSLSCTPAEVYNFVTDMRNLERFVPSGTINNWHSERDKCSFGVSIIGTVSVRVMTELPYSKVIFSGDALKKNDFSLVLEIRDSTGNKADVKLILEAELNPMLKMMAGRPVTQFLEILITEMEKFTDWANIIK